MLPFGEAARHWTVAGPYDASNAGWRLMSRFQIRSSAGHSRCEKATSCDDGMEVTGVTRRSNCPKWDCTDSIWLLWSVRDTVVRKSS